MSLKYGSFEVAHGNNITIPTLFVTNINFFEAIEKYLPVGDSIMWINSKKYLNPTTDYLWLLPFITIDKKHLILEIDRVTTDIKVLQETYTALYNQEKFYGAAYNESIRLRKQRIDITELGLLQEKVFTALMLSFLNRTIVKMDLIKLDSQFESLDNILEEFDFESEMKCYNENPNPYGKYHHDYLLLKNILRQTLYLPNELRRHFTNVESLHLQIAKYLSRIPTVENI